MLQCRKAIVATVMLLTVLILLSCSSNNNQRFSKNTKVVTYYDDGGFWKTEAYLKAHALIPSRKYLVFGAEWCHACRTLVKLLYDANVIGYPDLIFLNVDQAWVQLLIHELGDIRGVPYMLEIKEDGSFGDHRAGLGSILTYLISNVEVERKLKQ